MINLIFYINKKYTYFLFIFIFCLSINSANPASSSWYTTEEMQIRLLTMGVPSKNGLLLGALQIKLHPQWKTYWKDTALSGTEPAFELVSGKKVEIEFPAPQWYVQSGLNFALYKDSLTLPIRLPFSKEDGPLLETKIALNLCNTMCIPIKTVLRLNPYSKPENPEELQIIKEAFEKLPLPARPSFGVTLTRFNGKELHIKAHCPKKEDCKSAELFIASREKGYVLEKPILSIENNELYFVAKVLIKPQVQPEGKGLEYTLKTKYSSVKGLIPYF